MKDSVIPSVTAKADGDININIPTTDAQLLSQGYTYNQANLTYNEVGVKFGGVQDANEEFLPILFTANEDIPSLNVTLDYINLSGSDTDATLIDQGYTYNEAGVSFNQVGVEYGGIQSVNQDILPLELSFSDIYSQFIPPPVGGNIPLGPGWFLFVPQ